MSIFIDLCYGIRLNSEKKEKTELTVSMTNEKKRVGEWKQRGGVRR